MNRFYVVSYALLFLLPGLVCSRAPESRLFHTPYSLVPLPKFHSPRWRTTAKPTLLVGRLARIEPAALREPTSSQTSACGKYGSGRRDVLMSARHVSKVPVFGEIGKLSNGKCRAT